MTKTDILRAIVLVLASVSLLPIGSGALGSQTVANGVQQMPQVPGLLFDPLHQKPLSYSDDTMTIKLAVKGEQLSLAIQRRAAATATQVALPGDMAQANEIRRVQPDKAVVVGMLNGDLWEVAVIDLDTPSISDRFLCYEPAISPDGHYVSFIKFFPAHAAEGAEDHYMLYDLWKGSARNRPPSNSPDDWQTVGATVYPVGIGNRDFDNLHRHESAVHMLSSDGFFWNASSNKVLFADSYQGQVSLILVYVERTTATTKIANVPAAVCGDKPSRDGACSVRLVKAAFGKGADEGLTLTFRGAGTNIGLQRSLQFVESQFSTLGSFGL